MMAIRFIVDSGCDILPSEAETLGIIHLPLKVREKSLYPF